MPNKNHYTFIQAICDADYRVKDAENPFLENYTLEYMIQLHESMKRRANQKHTI